MITLRTRDGILPLVFVWAYIAIAMEQRDISDFRFTAIILAFILLLYAFCIVLMRESERY